MSREMGALLPKEVAENVVAARTDLVSSEAQAAQVQRKPALAFNQRAQAELDAAAAAIQRVSAQQLAQALPNSALMQSQSQAAKQAQTPPGQSSEQSPQGSQSAQTQPVNRNPSTPSSTQTAAGQPPPGQSQTASNPTAAGQPPGSANQTTPGQSQPAQSQTASSQNAAGQPPASNPTGTGPNQASAQNQQNGPPQSNQGTENSSKGQQPGGNRPAAGQSQTAQSGSQPGNNPPSSEPGSGRERDRYLQDGGKPTGYTAVNGPTASRQREAVALFQNEKVPSEYSEMVQQYSKNLAEGRVPAK